MPRVTLYSSSRRASAPEAEAPRTVGVDAVAAASGAAPAAAVTGWSRLKAWRRTLLLAAGAAVVLAAGGAYLASQPAPRRITQQDIEDAVQKALETVPLPSQATRAYEIIRPSVVRVRGFGTGRDGIEISDNEVQP